MENDTQQQSEKKSSSVSVEEEELSTSEPEKIIAQSKSFLEYLQESNPTYPELDTNYEGFNAGTLRTGNGEHHNRQISSLSDLFDPPKPPEEAMAPAKTTKEKESMERRDKISNYEEFNGETIRAGNSDKSNSKVGSLSGLFDPPKPPLPTTSRQTNG